MWAECGPQGYFLLYLLRTYYVLSINPVVSGSKVWIVYILFILDRDLIYVHLEQI